MVSGCKNFAGKTSKDKEKIYSKNIRICSERSTSSGCKLAISLKDRRLKTLAIPTKKLPSKNVGADQQQQSQQKRKVKCLTRDIPSSNSRFKNESYSQAPVDIETCTNLGICDAKINNKETQTEINFESNNQSKIIELKKKQLSLEINNENTLKELQEANSLKTSICKIFTKEQIKRLRNPNKKLNWTAEDIYSTISSHLSLLLLQQKQQKNLHQSSPLQSINQNLPININNIVNSCNNDNTNKTKFKCDQCNMIFNSKKILTSHVNLHKNQQQHDQLYNVISTNITTRSHSKYGDGLIPRLPLRSPSLSLATAIAQVSSTGGGLSPIQGKVSQKPFNFRHNLNKHHRLHTGERPFECEFCHKMFSIKGNLQVHQRIHHSNSKSTQRSNIKPHKKLQQQHQQLQHPGNGFSSNITTRTHSKYSNGLMSTSPSRSSSSSLSKTIVQSSSIGGGSHPNQCKICQKTFTLIYNLNQHHRIHTGERPFECTFCHKKFGRKPDLKVHQRIHTKERPYKCDECGKTFGSSSKLHRHLKMHTGKRPHKCSVCDRAFKESGDLVRHRRTHTDEEPYKCPVEDCGKCFKHHTQLRRHSHTHTCETPQPSEP